MPGTRDPEGVVGEWVRKADNDLTNAEHTLTLGDRAPADTICFHAQQCVEKYLKALLVHKGVGFAKTHEIADLVALLPGEVRPALTAEEQERLTDYIVARYPGPYDPIVLDEARRAAEVARRVRDEVRKLLPREALCEDRV